ncbi:MAG: DUF1194 domain-containing protein [Alphaproteobacteria bacterium]|nr:DUF1194 domain-containing protein [Alphaproteobacteria bacterium]
MGLGAAICLFLLTLGLVLAAPARSAEVDLQLVLAVDVSRSIDDQEYELQKRGYAEAFEHPAVLQAIRAGKHRAIAVTLIEWSGADHQQVQVPWSVITDEASARDFFERLMATRRAFWGWTSISAAIDFAVRVLADCPHVAERRVIDVSGDGVNNSGRPVHHARDDALAGGVIVNGLVIMNDRPVPGFVAPRQEPPLDDFYREQVIGGPGAFLIVVDDFVAFAHALRNKLIREIAGDIRPVTLAEASLDAR